MIRPSLLQRVLLREMTVTTLICLGGFLCLILLGRLLQLRDLFMGQGVSFTDMAELFLYLSPFFMLLLVPVSCMMGLFVTFVRMGADRELISLRAGGLGYGALLPAPMLLCLLCSGLTLWISLVGISWGMDNFRRTVIDIARHKTEITVQPGVFNAAFPGLTIYAKQTEPESGLLSDVFVRDVSRPSAQSTILARRGHIDANAEHGQIYVLLENGHVYRESRGELSVVDFDRYVVTLDMTALLGGFELKDKAPKEMSLAALRTQLERPSGEIGEHAQRMLRIELHKRFALPAACLVLGLCALPLAFLFQGMNRQFGLVAALGLFLMYYLMISAGVSLAETGKINPGIAMWMPNLIFLAGGGCGLWAVVHSFNFDIQTLLCALRRRIQSGRHA